MRTTRFTRLSIGVAVLALALPVFAQSPTAEGTWSTRARERDDGSRRIQLSLEIDRNGRGSWNTGFGIDDADLDGLSFEQARGDVDNARFELVRDAGTVIFEGVIRNGRGAGTFEFVPDPAWQREMSSLGYDDLSDEQVLQGALHDISTAWVRELRQLGYTDLSERQLFNFAIHRVSPEFIREMGSLGYADVPAGKLVQLRIHGVSPDWVREVRRAMGG